MHPRVMSWKSHLQHSYQVWMSRLNLLKNWSFLLGRSGHHISQHLHGSKTISQQGYIMNTWNKWRQRLERYLLIPVHDQSNICFRKCIKCPPQGIYYVFCFKLREEGHNTSLSVGMCCKTCLIRTLRTTLLGSENHKIRTEYLHLLQQVHLYVLGKNEHSE